MTGFTFQVVSEEGSPLIRRRVLIAALEAEQKSQTAADRAEAALTAANYDFLDVKATSQHLVQVDVSPKRRRVMRVNGSVFLEEDSADLVRIEGTLQTTILLDTEGSDHTRVPPNRWCTCAGRDELER